VGSGGCGSDGAAAGASPSVSAAVESTAGPWTSHSRSQRLWTRRWDVGASPLAPPTTGATAGPRAPPSWSQRQQERHQGRRRSATRWRQRQWLRRLPSRLHAWVTPRTPPHAPPCSPLPRARQLEPAPRRLVGGTAADVSRPHQEDRLAQGQLTNRAIAFATTGGDAPPNQPRQGLVCAVLPGTKLVRVVLFCCCLRQHLRARRRFALSCDVRCVPRGRWGTSRGTQASGGQPRSQHLRQVHRPHKVEQAGSSQPWSVWGANSLCIGARTAA
jgi:hypothetical protein